MQFLKNRFLTACRLAGRVALMAGALALVGCQSENAMDYLPKASGGYMGMNAVSMKESAGLKRLNEQMSQLQSGTQFESEKAEKMIMAFDAPANTGAAPPIYGVAVGQPGFADELVNQYKQAGAQEGKKAGRATFTSGSVSIAPVGDSGVLIFQTDAALERMINVSKKKEEGARTSAVFTFVNAEVTNHAFVVAAAAQPLIEMGGPLLATFERGNAQAASALRQVSMISLTFDWDKNPIGVVQLHLGDKAGSDALAGALNQYIQLARGLPMLNANPAVQQVLAPLRAESAEDGVRLKVEVPAEVAEQLFQQIPTGLPQQ
jgi:hypothetical protein